MHRWGDEHRLSVQALHHRDVPPRRRQRCTFTVLEFAKYVKIEKTLRPGTQGLHFCEVSRAGTSVDTERRWGSPRMGGGGGDVEGLGVTVTGLRVASWSDENVLQPTGGGCPALAIARKPWMCML